MDRTKLDISAWNLGVPLAVLTACGPVVPIDDTNSHGDTDTIGTTEDPTVDPPECRTAVDCPPTDYGSNCIDGQCIPNGGYYCGEYGCCDDGCCYGECGWYPECYYDTDCGLGNICENNYCIPAPVPVECEGVVLAVPIPILEGEDEILSFTFVEALPAAGRELAFATPSGISVIASDGSSSDVAVSGVVEIASADLDADGDEDLVVVIGGDATELRSLLADGLGGFVGGGTMPVSSSRIAFGDFDLDGLVDLVVGADGLYVHHGLGTGAFDPAQQLTGETIVALASMPASVGPGADVLFYPGEQLWLATAGSGLQPDPIYPSVSFTTAQALVVGDYDGDGWADASVIDSSTGVATIYTWPRVASDPSASTWAPIVQQGMAATGDVDGDGRDDLAHTGPSGELEVRFGGAPSDELDPLGCYVLGSLAASPTRVLVDDFDGDGRGDVIAAAGSALWRTRLQ